MHSSKRNNFYRWGDSETKELLELIVEEISDNPESFENPTAKQFYEGIKAKSMKLRDVDYKAMRGKIRCLKLSYISTRDYINSLHTGFMNEKDCVSIEDYINKKCKYYNLLEKIFGEDCSDNTTAVCKSPFTSMLDNIESEPLKHENIEALADNSSSEYEEINSCSPLPVFTAEPIKFSALTNEPQMAMDRSHHQSPISVPPRKTERTLSRKRKAFDDLIRDRIETQKYDNDKRLEFEKLKYNAELELNRKKLVIEEKRVAIEEKRILIEQQRNDIQIKANEMSFEIKKIEIEANKEVELLKLQSAERLKMAEIELLNKNN